MLHAPAGAACSVFLTLSSVYERLTGLCQDLKRRAHDASVGPRWSTLLLLLNLAPATPRVGYICS